MKPMRPLFFLLSLALTFSLSSSSLAESGVTTADAKPAVVKNDAPGSLKKGNELLDTGRYEDAVAYFNGIGEQSSPKREPYRLLGLSTALVETGKYDDAISAAHKAVTIKKDLSGAWNILASAQARSGKRGDAVATYGKAIAILKEAGADTSTLEANLAELRSGMPQVTQSTIQPQGAGALAPASTRVAERKFDNKQEAAGKFEFFGPSNSHWGENIDAFVAATLGLRDDGTWVRFSQDAIAELYQRTGKKGSPGVLLNDSNGTTWRITTSENVGREGDVVQVLAMNYQKNVNPMTSSEKFDALVARYTNLLGPPSISRAQQRVAREWIATDQLTSIKLEIPDEADEWVRANEPDPYPFMTITLSPRAAARKQATDEKPHVEEGSGAYLRIAFANSLSSKYPRATGYLFRAEGPPAMTTLVFVMDSMQHSGDLTKADNNKIIAEWVKLGGKRLGFKMRDCMGCAEQKRLLYDLTKWPYVSQVPW